MTTLTIRKSTDEERRERVRPLVAGGPRPRIPKYVVVSEAEIIVTVFGIPMGGDTQAEAVYWAERTASKNDLDFVRPSGWERIVGKLP